MHTLFAIYESGKMAEVKLHYKPTKKSPFRGDFFVVACLKALCKMTKVLKICSVFVYFFDKVTILEKYRKKQKNVLTGGGGVCYNENRSVMRRIVRSLHGFAVSGTFFLQRCVMNITQQGMGRRKNTCQKGEK